MRSVAPDEPDARQAALEEIYYEIATTLQTANGDAILSAHGDPDYEDDPHHSLELWTGPIRLTDTPMHDADTEPTPAAASGPGPPTIPPDPPDGHTHTRPASSTISRG